jgi:SAM-dependent MidA family methyltransferase
MSNKLPKDMLKELIETQGGVPIDQFMKCALTASDFSYYRNIKNIGAEGDFTTAPEISQMFGEIVGLKCIESWCFMGNPSEIDLVELGPGQGTLIKDVLRTVSRLAPKMFKNINIKFLDLEVPNSYLSELRHRNLYNFDKSPSYINHIKELTPLPSIILANEFLDALPSKQYVKFKGKWFEITVIYDSIESKFQFGRTEINQTETIERLSQFKEVPEEGIVEISDATIEMLSILTRHILKNKGSVWIADYGYNISPYARSASQYLSTLQAIRDHKYCDILDSIGLCDISTHVDFNALTEVLNRMGIAYSLSSQRDFLIKYGILVRAFQLRKTLPEIEKRIIDNQLDRLMSPAQMGDLFKILTFGSY